MKNFLENNSFFAYILGGSVAAFIMAMLRSGGFSKKNLRMRLSEAFMCSMLSSALTIMALHHFDVTEYIALPISVFCGFLGTDFIKSLLVGWIEYKNIRIKKENDNESK